MAFWRVFLCLTVLGACKNTTSAPDIGEGDRHPTASEATLLLATVDHLRLRLTPDGEGEVVHALREGETIIWYGETSPHQEELVLRGQKIKAPWYKVHTHSGKAGWAFAGGLEPWQSGRGVPYRECLQSFNTGDFSGFYPCLDRISHTVSGPEKVTVTSGYLRLRLLNGEHRQLNHVREPGADYRFYQYLGTVGGSGDFVVKVNRQGGSGFLLVGRQSGEILEVAGIPQPLPLSTQLLCLGVSPGNPGNYTLQIIQPQGKQFKVTLEQQFESQSLQSLTWPKDGMPLMALRDTRGNLATWRLTRKSNDRWDLERQG